MNACVKGWQTTFIPMGKKIVGQMIIGAFIGLVVVAITVNVHLVRLAVFALEVKRILSVTAIRFVGYERVAVCKAG